jgi:lipopolysaccharide biosynthesis glycosyltransferase
VSPEATPTSAHHVAFVADAPYLPWCATAIRSCLDQDWTLPPVVHLLHDGSVTGPAGADALARMVDTAGGELRLHEIDPSTVGHLPALDRFGTIVWLRFLLPALLPDVARVLYLDADTLVVAPLEPLFALPLDEGPIGAVANVVDEGLWPHVRALGIADPTQFFNSGVLLMDLTAMRDEGSADTLLHIAVERGHELRWPDQDALNIAFAGRWSHLHPRWNAQNSLWEWRPLAERVFGATAVHDATTNPAIVHFEGPLLCKPWHSLNHHVWRDEYWRVLRTTPWADKQPEDNTLATRIIARLPQDRQLAVFLSLARWRLRREQGVKA